MPIAVVVDVLSFTTTLTIAADRGVTVFPFPWRDDRAAAFATECRATLAVGRSQAQPGQVSLSPRSIRAARSLERLVLLSPNGSTISFQLGEAVPEVIGVSLRNRCAAGGWTAVSQRQTRPPTRSARSPTVCRGPSPIAPARANDLVSAPFDNDRHPWRAWSIDELTMQFGGLMSPNGRSARWAVAGGWALDLFLGRLTREHEDVEVVVLHDDVLAVLAAFPAPRWRWWVPTDGWLHPLQSPAYRESHQTWLWCERTGAFVLDVFRTPHDRDTWICRRDNRIRRPWPEVARRSPGGTPYLAPEVVLLFKAKWVRPKDVRDLRVVQPALGHRRRAWLREGLIQIHPGHAWLELLKA